jgi:hypothetical protein
MLQPLQYHKGFMCKPAGEMAQWNGPPFGTTKVACANQLVSRFGMVPFCTTKVFMFKSSGEQIWYSHFWTTKAYVQTRW